MNTENSKTNESNKFVHLSIYYTWKNTNTHEKTLNLNITKRSLKFSPNLE